MNIILGVINWKTFCVKILDMCNYSLMATVPVVTITHIFFMFSNKMKVEAIYFEVTTKIDYMKFVEKTLFLS